ncbi:MAG: YdcF family protein [Pseudomonadota bacterium]
MNYILWGLFGPVSWPFWIGLVALICIWRGWRFGKAFGVVALSIFGVFGFSPFGQILIAGLEDTYTWDLPETPPSDIIVLAGGEDLYAAARSGRFEQRGHGERVTEAVLLARRYPTARLYIAGFGDSSGKPASDTAITKALWRDLGVDAARIVEIEATRDTCENLAGFVPYAHETSGAPALLVTSGFHMPRTMACATKHGVSVHPYPVDRKVTESLDWTPDVATNLHLVSLALHEYAGLVWYRATGRID